MAKVIKNQILAVLPGTKLADYQRMDKKGLLAGCTLRLKDPLGLFRVDLQRTHHRLSFFTPIPCTYTSLVLDGKAMNDYCLSTWIRKITQFVVSGSILLLPPYTRGEKKTFGLSWN